MAKFINKGSADPGSEGEDAAKKRQQLLLLLFLVIIAAFAYLYYFTDLILQRQKPTTPPPAQTAQVKQPIPPRPQAPSTTPAPPQGATSAPSPTSSDSKAPLAGTEKKGAAAVPAPTAPPVVAKVEPAKPVAIPVSKESPKSAAPSGPATKVVKPATPTAVAAKQPKVKEAAVPAGKTSAKESRLTAKSDAKSKGPETSSRFALVIGNFTDASQVKAARAKLAKIGLKQVTQKNVKLVEPMNRLLIGTFPDRTAAEMELQNVRKATVDGFILPENGSYAVYAGSYLSENLAVSELKRIKTLGVRGEIRRAKLPVQVVQLSAGAFTSKTSADEAATKLRKNGYKTLVAKLK